MGRAENEATWKALPEAHRKRVVWDMDCAVTSLRDEIVAERLCQIERWGDCEKLPYGTRNGGANVHMLTQARQSCDRAYREGRLTHAHVLEEEVYEVLTEEDPVKLRIELIQVAAVVAKWIQDIDSRAK